MQIRIRKRHDDPRKRRWFWLLCGDAITKEGRFEIKRVFFPWFYVDLMFQKPTT